MPKVSLFMSETIMNNNIQYTYISFGVRGNPSPMCVSTYLLLSQTDCLIVYTLFRFLMDNYYDVNLIIDING